MTTKLDKPLRREVMIRKEAWVVTLQPDSLKLTRKGHRKGIELEWVAIVSGDAALAAALNASTHPKHHPPRASVRTSSAPRGNSVGVESARLPSRPRKQRRT